MKGVFNRILNIDLNEKSFKYENIEDSVYEKYIGGKGLGSFLLLKKNRKGIDPFSPENHLIFAIGPANGAKVHGSSRYGVFTKAPLTGFYSESYSGGTVAPYISATGCDAIMLSGASSMPIYLEISDESVLFKDANDLWGKDTYSSEEELKRRSPSKKCGVVVIGPAGENLVRFATLANDFWRCAGRTGIGAVMGFKKVKGIIFYGNSQKELACPDIIQDYITEMVKRSKGNPIVEAYKRFGTPMQVPLTNHLEAFPSRYWRQGTMENWQKLSAEAMQEILKPKPKSCPLCFMACGKLSTVRSGRHKGLTIEGPDYETIYSFGGLCLIDSLEEVAYLNDICDRLGLDTMTSGNLAAFTMLASERGAIKERYDFGNMDKVANLLRDIAYRRGIGGILADGILNAAAQWKLEEEAVHVKGLEPAGFDPRVLKGMALAYATSDRGACHLRSTFYKPELSGMIPPNQVEGKAEAFIDWEDRMNLMDAMILCRFFRDLVLYDEISKIIEGTTGRKMDQSGLKEVSARIQDLTRAFNLGEGLTHKDDQLPSLFFREKLPQSGKILKREEFEYMLSSYYRLRGWDEQGRLPEEKLNSLLE
jgi:aldehyde:ferredoxin oxidoreductase